jgi:hypothetical protein
MLTISWTKSIEQWHSNRLQLIKNKKYEPLVVLSSNLPSQLVVLFSQMGSHHPQILSPIQPILVVGASLFIKNKFGG